MLRKTIPVARRVLGENDDHAQMRWVYAQTVQTPAPRSTTSQGRTTLEETERTARRVFGGAHPITMGIECRRNGREPRSRPRDAARRG